MLLYLEEFATNGKPLPDATEAVRMELIEVEQAEIEQFACAPGSKSVQSSQI